MNEKVYQILEFHKIIGMLEAKADSEPAKQLCRKLHPSADLAEITKSQEDTSAALTRLFRQDRLTFAGCSEIRPVCRALEIGRALSAADLIRIADLLECAQRVHAYGDPNAKDSITDCLTPYFEQLVLLPDLNREIRRCIISAEEIADDASAKLSSIRRNILSINDKIHDKLAGYVNSSLRPYLQDAVVTMRDNRYCIPVKAEYKGQVAGIVHDQSSTGSTLFKGRHPLLDRKQVVPIDIRLGEDFDLLIVTGPNTGGKTVSLKTVGLLTLMGQAGLHIPAADRSRLGIFKDVFADIGDEQSIEQSLSTFSAHMTNIVTILKHADAGSLCLFDELGAGTDPTEGAALAIAILTYLHDRGIRSMATTHYSELKIFALSTDYVENACCEFDVKSLRPTYKLLIGIPGKSNAFAISKRLGLSDEIIESAKTHISKDAESFEDVIAGLEKRRIEMERQQLEIDKYKRETQSLKDQLQSKQEKLDTSRDKILREANEEAREILLEAKAAADEAIRRFQRLDSSSADIRGLEDSRQKLNSRISEKNSKLSIPSAKQEHHAKVRAADLKPGDSVKIVSMGLKGTVSTLPDASGNLFVMCGIMRTKTNVKDLVLLQDSDDATRLTSTKKTGKSSSSGLSKSMHISTEINLLGKTVDEAIAELDKYLDDAYLSHVPSVRIVHGKGTGALRNAIHQHLKRLKYIDSYRLGEFGEGDSGVTIATFH